MKKLTNTEAKRLETYLLKARNYIASLEEKYEDDIIQVSNDMAYRIEDCLVSVSYVVNNSKD